MGRTLKTKKNPARHVRASVVHAAILELSTVHKIRTVSHTSRYQKSAYLEEPCLDLLEIPSRKALRSCTICFWYTNRTTWYPNRVFGLSPSLRTALRGSDTKNFGLWALDLGTGHPKQMQPEARTCLENHVQICWRYLPENPSALVQSVFGTKNWSSDCPPGGPVLAPKVWCSECPMVFSSKSKKNPTRHLRAPTRPFWS